MLARFESLRLFLAMVSLIALGGAAIGSGFSSPRVGNLVLLVFWLPRAGRSPKRS